MRFSTLATTLLATLVAARPQDAEAGDSTMMQTYTMTRTVQRVVETVTATRDLSSSTTLSTASTVSPPLGTASAGIFPQGNGTSVVLGTAAGPSSGVATSVPTGLSESGAGRVGFEMLGLMAVVGLAGLAL